MKHIRCAASSLAIVLATHLGAQSCHDLQGVTEIGQDMLQQSPLRGSSCISIEQRGTNVYAQSFGSLGPTDVIPIASATKTLSAAVLMSLVDSGVVALDDPVGLYLPEWNVGPLAQITLRMCFAHTSGMPANDPAIIDTTLTLRQAALQLASVPLESTPGTAFAYGNVAMHVAGAVCEVATGQSWATLFQQRIALPLGMTSTDYGDPKSTNPVIAGGARSNLEDFAAFMSMLRAYGSAGATQVLSRGAVDTMLREQTAGTISMRNVHPNQAAYGIGIWVERQTSSGETLRAAAIGAFGFTGWVDRAHDCSGVVSVRYTAPMVFPFTERIHGEVDAALLPDGVTCLGTGSPTCAAGTWLNGSMEARAGSVDFALIASRAPASALGILAIGAPIPGGLRILDLTAFVDPTISLTTTILSDADGVAVVPTPLSPGLAGQSFSLQTVWFDGAACTREGLQASHAIIVRVQP